MNNILISSAGKRVSLLKSFKSELIKFFPDAKIIAIDANPMLSAACHAADSFSIVPRLDERNYIIELINICKLFQVSLIIPTIDTELLLLSENETSLLKEGIIPIISSADFVKKCKDKRLTHKFFESHGIKTALEYSKTDYSFPIFIKPVDGSRSVDTFIIKKYEDFRTNHFKDDRLMFLEYLDRSVYDEYTCDLYYGIDSMLKCVVPRKRIEVRDGEVNKGKTEKNNLVQFVKEHLNIIEGVKGCLTLQLFKHKTENSIIGIEINPRFGGGYPLSYYAGANFPKWIIQEYILNQTIVPFDDWEDNLLMLRYDSETIIHGFKD
jgi:carbamoyl-phosphate synthase large subunit